MEAKLRQRLMRALAIVDEHGTSGSRLMDDGDRLWRRCQALLPEVRAVVVTREIKRTPPSSIVTCTSACDKASG